MHDNDNHNQSHDGLNSARGIAIGITASVLLWLVIVEGVMLWYKCAG